MCFGDKALSKMSTTVKYSFVVWQLCCRWPRWHRGTICIHFTPSMSYVWWHQAEGTTRLYVVLAGTNGTLWWPQWHHPFHKMLHQCTLQLYFMHPTKVMKKYTNIQKYKNPKQTIHISNTNKFTNIEYKKYTVPKIQNAQSSQSAHCGRVFCAPNFPSLKGGAVKCQILCTWLRWEGTIKCGILPLISKICK